MTEPVGNNTASAGATLNFMYYSGVGAAPSETGLYFNGNGNIHFAPTQTFPITQGPAGPQGPIGPAGPKGATGATGPQGPAGTLALPYSATANGGGKYLFTLTDTGTAGGGGIYASGETGANPEGVINVYTTGGSGVTGQGGVAFNGYGSYGGAGVVGMGGASGNAESAYGGSGVVGVGGNATSTYSLGGAGGTFTGGSASSNPAGNGINAIGGAGLGGYPAGTGIYAQAGSGGDFSYAGEFQGDVDISGNLSKSGGSFKIDDPIDPANKYLYHSFVESPDMKNIYDGTIVTDGRGEAVVTMPNYFQALNTDFRYQLTVMGQFAQAVVGSEISGNTFVIKTDKPNVKVSWQVTGVRQDAWANAHRIPNEEVKPEKDRGHFLHPELFGHANEAGILELKHSARLSAQPQ
jgi:trimeric autotransporter adhesin